MQYNARARKDGRLHGGIRRAGPAPGTDARHLRPALRHERRRAPLDLFPACTQPAPLLIFIHGGYWHSQRKRGSLVRWPPRLLAAAWRSPRWNTLAPEATLARSQMSASAVTALSSRALGHRSARIFVAAVRRRPPVRYADRRRLAPRASPAARRDQRRAGAGSGLYDLRPLCDVYINDWLHLTLEQAQTLSPRCFLLPWRRNMRRRYCSTSASGNPGLKPDAGLL